MSRASSSLAHRPLSTTEELEKLEQAITLTLQEIDRNFSKAHRIVTTTILPVVEQYGEQCQAVWDASKFWKQFFEAAANVSLSGYEELAANDESTAAPEETTTATHDDEYDETSTDYTPRQHDDGGGGDDERTITRDESLLSDGDGDLTGSTPRPPATKSLRPQFADMRSPYETLRQELKLGKEAAATATAQSVLPKAPAGDNEDDDDSSLMIADSSRAHVDDNGDYGDGDDDSSAADSLLLAERTARLPDMSMTPRLSLDERHRQAAEEELATEQRQKNPLLHRVLDKTYRIQATPHKAMTRGISPMRLKVTTDQQQQQQPLLPREQKKKSAWQDSSPMSSPEMAVPKLRSAAFMSPVRAAYRSKLTAAVAGPRTPGVSVQTPAMKSRARDITFDDLDVDVNTGMDAEQRAVPYGGAAAAAAAAARRNKRNPEEITWESSDEDGDDLYGGISPPKTISFALPPSKLLQTPAREASKRIVEDILYTAGDDTDNPSEYSPTMVKMNANILDETF